MAKKKSRTSRVSSGKMAGIHKAQEEKRQTKLAARKEAGKGYEYKKNPFKKNTFGYEAERVVRWHKQNDGKLPYARITGLFRKLQNKIDAEKAAEKEKSVKVSKKEVANG